MTVKPKKTIEFYYTVSCGLDCYQMMMDEMPTPDQAYDIIMNHCFQNNIDPYFAGWATAWWEWGKEKKSFSLSTFYRQSREEETARRYAAQKEKFKPKVV